MHRAMGRIGRLGARRRPGLCGAYTRPLTTKGLVHRRKGEVTMMRRLFGWAALFAAGACALPAGSLLAQETKGPVNDALFAAAAGVGGLAEVGSSRLATQRATGAEVKKFAQQMVDDHTMANQELTSL